jgi:hypothetical protein
MAAIVSLRLTGTKVLPFNPQLLSNMYGNLLYLAGDQAIGQVSPCNTVRRKTKKEDNILYIDVNVSGALSDAGPTFFHSMMLLKSTILRFLSFSYIL